jgi:hypothetical protein
MRKQKVTCKEGQSPRGRWVGETSQQLGIVRPYNKRGRFEREFAYIAWLIPWEVITLLLL